MESEGRESNIIDQQIDFTDISLLIEEDQENVPFSSESFEQEKSEKSSSGFCVKEYEQKLNNLSKENFNLKLRLYFLEEKNPNIPQGAEALYKENIDLKIEIDTIQKDLHEKQSLCFEAYKALQLLEEEKLNDNQQAQVEIEELNQKLLNLQSEYDRLQLKIESSENNNQNDTGFTEFLGMVDKNSELLKCKADWKDKENRLNFQINKLEKEKEDLNSKINDLKSNLESANEKLTEADIKMKEMNENIKFFKNLYDQKLKEFNRSQNENEFLEKIYKNMRSRLEEFQNFQNCIKLNQNFDSKTHLNEVKVVKDKLASSECDLMDAKDKVDDLAKEKSKLIKIMKEKLEELSREKKKIVTLENQISNFSSSNSTTDEAKNLANATLQEYRDQLKSFEKEKRILESNLKETEHKYLTELKQYKQIIDEQTNQSSELRIQLADARKQLRNQTAQDLSQKSLQIEHLSNLMKSIQLSRTSSFGSSKPRMSLSKVSESFNELQYEQAMQEKKISQDKINNLLAEITEIANAKTKEHVEKLQKQISIVNQKQEITDNALKSSTELCSVTFDHLKELAQFLTILLGHDSFKSTLDDATIDQLQSVLDRTLEFSTRLSIDSRISLVDASSLNVLIDATRQSLANVKDIKTMNISMQTSTDSRVLELSAKFSKLQEEFNELNRVNQQLEDEIVLLKNALQSKQQIIDEKECNVKKLKDELNEATKVNERQNEMIENFEKKNNELEKILQEETVKRIQSSDEVMKMDKINQKLNEKLVEMQTDLAENWIPKINHDDKVNQLKEEIVACEAQIAAVNMEIESKLGVIEELRTENSALENLLKSEDKENVKPVRRTLEVSENRRKLILGESNIEKEMQPVAPTMKSENKTDEVKALVRPDLCTQCPVFKAKYLEYKKHLGLAIDKIKSYDQMRKMQEQLIKGQLQKTQTVLQHVATNMDQLNSKK